MILCIMHKIVKPIFKKIVNNNNNITYSIFNIVCIYLIFTIIMLLRLLIILKF